MLKHNGMWELVILDKIGAEEKTRTSTRLPSHEPESLFDT